MKIISSAVLTTGQTGHWLGPRAAGAPSCRQR